MRYLALACKCDETITLSEGPPRFAEHATCKAHSEIRSAETRHLKGQITVQSSFSQCVRL